MDICFADDSRQRRPSRPGMGPLVAIGGIHVPGEQAYAVEKEINLLCDKTGFPQGEEFKWSPGRELSMYDDLKEHRREEFFASVLGLLESSGVKAMVVIEDETSHPAKTGANPEEDVTLLFLERAQIQLSSARTDGIVVVDRPGGDRVEEDKFVVRCLETLREGTDFMNFDRIGFVFTSNSKFVRLLQAADLITSCTTAFVGGEPRHAPQTFEAIKPLLRKGGQGTIGGSGLKIHPDGRYLNLYHWLVGDTHYWRRGVGLPLPSSDSPYFTDPFVK